MERPVLRPGRRSTTTVPVAGPGRAPRSARPTTTRPTAWSSPSTVAGYTLLVEGRVGDGDEGAAAGPARRRRGRPGPRGGRRLRRRGLAGPDRRGPGAGDHAAAYRRGRRPGGAGDRGQRRPAGRGHRAGRPRAAAAADRPRPGGGVRRRAGAAALPDQVRPGRPGAVARDLPLAGRAVGRSPGAAGTCAELRERLEGRVSVLLGSSGVGKSTLVNALVPMAMREVGRSSTR